MDRDPDKLRAWQRRSKPLQVKKGLKPGKPLQRSSPQGGKHPPKRRKPIAPRNKERIARRKAKGDVYGPYYQAVKALNRCWLAGHPKHRCRFFARRRGIEGDHLKTVGSGGKDENNVWPVCPGLHDLRHAKGPKHIERVFTVDLKRVCEVEVPSLLTATESFVGKHP